MELLLAATPEAWLQEAVRQRDLLVIDHANCEKKAASTALALMFTYAEDERLTLQLSRLAREELRHFEQVDKLMQQLAVPAMRMPAGRYAAELRRGLATGSALRKVDLMLAGALIEARSCERFELLAPRLPAPLGGFYGDLAVAERRHHELYLQLGREAAAAIDPDPAAVEALVSTRLAQLSALEADLATRPDVQFRFHSGPPPVAAA